jgi:hypothetical protein
MVLQGLGFTVFGGLFLLIGLGAALFRAAISKEHRAWMEMFVGRRGRLPTEAMSAGTWLSIGVIFGLLGVGLLFVGLNLLLRH